MEAFKKKKPTLGLALSGSGNRSPFYIGFLEVLAEQNIKIDYISACSGGCLVAAAFACGTLEEFKQFALSLDMKKIKTFLKRSKDPGGLFSMEEAEKEIRKYTKNLNFEDVKPLMGFVAVDIQSGEKVLLSMGDIAQAAKISCTLPGVFAPARWGGKILVDGGLLTMVPGDFLKQAGMDVTVGISMRGTKHIFMPAQITAKRYYNYIKKILFVENLDSWLNSLLKIDSEEKKFGLFKVLGRSLDIAVEANKKNPEAEEACDLTITPKVPRLKNSKLDQGAVRFYYDKGRECALEYAPKIKEMLEAKQI